MVQAFKDFPGAGAKGLKDDGLGVRGSGSALWFCMRNGYSKNGSHHLIRILKASVGIHLFLRILKFKESCLPFLQPANHLELLGLRER